MRFVFSKHFFIAIVILFGFSCMKFSLVFALFTEEILFAYVELEVEVISFSRRSKDFDDIKVSIGNIR